jgi:metal-responsive CopG/Arc/MetJ family transcriptional regulator
MTRAATKRITVVFPVDLLEELERYVPLRKRNQVITMATEACVRILKLLTVLKETAGAWSDKSHMARAS